MHSEPCPLAWIGRSIRRLWKEWVYDSASPPVKWEVHPHQVYKGVSRFFAALLGSIVPFGLFLLREGILEDLDKNSGNLGYTFWGVLTVFAALWLISVLGVSACEERSLTKYILLGSVLPANLMILSLSLQDYK